jgi:hypothetical protein
VHLEITCEWRAHLVFIIRFLAAGRYILAPDAQLRAARSLFVILSTEHEPVGVGFFVERNGLAVTANHMLADTDVPRSNSNFPSPPCLVDVLFYDASGQHTLSGHMEVVLRNSYLDVAVLATTQKDDGEIRVFTLLIFNFRNHA